MSDIVDTTIIVNNEESINKTILKTNNIQNDDDEDYENFVQDIKQNYCLNNELIALASEVTETYGIYNNLTNNSKLIDKNMNDEYDDDDSDGVIDEDILKLTVSTPIYESFLLNNNNNGNSNNIENYSDNDDDNNLNDDGNLDNDCLLPEFDWASLEAKLKEAQDELDKKNRFKNEREEIRRKLASMSTANENEDYMADYFKKSSSTKAHLLGQNLQICFMNESVSDNESDKDINKDLTIDNRLNKQLECTNAIFNQLLTSSSSSSHLSTTGSNASTTSSLSSSATNLAIKNECVLTKQLKLQQETKMALSNATQEAKLQIELEKKSKKPSPIADIVGIPTYGLKKLEKRVLSDMNIGQLQVIVNDLCSQIERTNEELKKLLIDRDDLYMKQDSILVDIEDLTKRIQEYSEKLSALRNEKEKQIQMSNSENIISSSSNSTNTNTSIKNSISTTLSNKVKSFQLGSITNRLYRFTKKTS